MKHRVIGYADDGQMIGPVEWDGEERAATALAFAHHQLATRSSPEGTLWEVVVEQPDERADRYFFAIEYRLMVNVRILNVDEDEFTRRRDGPRRSPKSQKSEES